MKPTRRVLFALAALAVLGGSALAAAPAPAPAASGVAPLGVVGGAQMADFHGGGGGGGDDRTRLFLRFHNALRCHTRVHVSFSDRQRTTYLLGPQDEQEFHEDGWRDDSSVSGVDVETFDCSGTVPSGTVCSRWANRWTSRFHRHIRFEIFGTDHGRQCKVDFGREW